MIGIGTNFPVTVPDDTNVAETASITSALTTFYEGAGVDPGIEDHLNTLNAKLNSLASTPLDITATWKYKNSEIVNQTALTSAVNIEAGARDQAIDNSYNAMLRVIDKVLPIGSIIMWSGHGGSIGSNAWANWRLCTGGSYVGTNYTVTIPDLKNKFIKASSGQVVGSAPGQVRSTGGSKTLPINEINLPSHSHSFVTDPSGWHDHSMSTNGGHAHSMQIFNALRRGGDWTTWIPATAGSDIYGGATNWQGDHIHSIHHNGTHTHGGNTHKTGSNQPLTVPDPVYYTLAFIIRVV